VGNVAGERRPRAPVHSVPRLAGHPGLKEKKRMAEREDRGGIAGISLGGIIVIVGIVLMIVWSFWIGLIVTLVGLIAFGGFARGRVLTLPEAAGLRE
jgi:hypothetical protein